MDAQTQLQDLILRYHRAHQSHDADALRACHADSYIRWLGAGSDDPTEWIPEAYCTTEYMAEWGKDAHVNSSRYTFEVEFESVRVGQDLAIVVTSESGRWVDAVGAEMTSWSSCRQIYFAALTKRGWRLAGMYWRDAS